MQKAAFLMSLGLVFSSNAALAAAPVLQLKARDGAQPSAIDAYPSAPQRDAIAQSTRTAYEPLPASGARLASTVFNDAVPSQQRRGRLQLIPVAANYDGTAQPVRSMAPVAVNAVAAEAPDMSGAVRPAVIGAASNDSLFYFLKNFKARPVQQPAHWTMFLVGLCFVLYQIRRRPMRAAIGFNAAARLIGGGNERRFGSGIGPGGMANAVSA